MRHRLTILTAPVESQQRFGLRAVRRYLGLLRNTLFFKRVTPASYYGGHSAVTRSLVEGLLKIGGDFNYNPCRIEDVGDTCHVLSNIEALKQSIQWKKNGRIKYLLAGPTLVVRSNEVDCILSSPEIDICLVPSQWVNDAYIEDEPTLSGRTRIWYVGVDEDYWKPRLPKVIKKNVLVYWKLNDIAFCEQIENFLIGYGMNPIRIVYGKYSKDEYKSALERSIFSIFMSRSESQGIALAESWAMDVPTLIWQSSEQLVINKRPYSSYSAAPYLNLDLGDSWETVDELEKLFESPKTYSPRKWLLDHMTDELSAKLLLQICQDMDKR